MTKAFFFGNFVEGRSRRSVLT